MRARARPPTLRAGGSEGEDARKEAGEADPQMGDEEGGEGEATGEGTAVVDRVAYVRVGGEGGGEGAGMVSCSVMLVGGVQIELSRLGR